MNVTCTSNNVVSCISSCVVIVSFMFYWRLSGRSDVQKMCVVNRLNKNESQCKPLCEHGYFSLYGMTHCRPWLTCDDIQRDVKTEELIGSGAVKMVYLGSWRGWSVAVNTLGSQTLREDFQAGMDRIAQLQPSPRIVQLIGLCPETDTYITEYHALGPANRLEQVLKIPQLTSFDTWKFRFGLCIDFVRIIQFLHRSPQGTLVMCDANDPDKALSQFLLTTNLTLVLNDADALPAVDHSAGRLIKCGHRELGGDFVAPEQLWPHEDTDFEDSLMPGYDEKVDIWKMPDVCARLLGDVAGAVTLKLNLFDIHSRCKEEEPNLRPCADEVLVAYEAVLQNLASGQSNS